MQFTYDSYKKLLVLLRNNNYEICDYHNFEGYAKCAILRHDIDNSIEAAIKMAEIENSLDIKATYFVLLTSDFYNPASAEKKRHLLKLQNLGHEIGLHFDEKTYEDNLGPEKTIEIIQREAGILSDILDGTPISTVSMHRPSKDTLEGDFQIPRLVNSYGKTFFHDFKYVSDSRRRWREPVEEIIESGECPRIHILTHAFWYHDKEETIEETISKFVLGANRERYRKMEENITNLSSIMGEVE